MLVLDKNQNYALITEKVKGKWWLELVVNETGQAYILYCNTKKHAVKAYKGLTLEQIHDFVVNKLDIKPEPMYKKNVAHKF